MEFREIEKLKVSPSLLGLGCMRFPIKEDKSIDEDKAQQLVDAAIEGGINYLDTAYPYHEGKSEEFMGKALAKYERETYYLATKLPVWLIKETSQVREYFEEQCGKLRTKYIDFYLLHALNKERWEEVKRLNIIQELEKLKEEDRIKFIGFSFHDEYSVFEEIITYRDWDFCQIQLNYVDTNIQQGIKGYELTEKLDIPLIIMEPVKGGALAKLPEEMENIFKGVNPNQTIASWAFRYIASYNNVKVVLSGMSDLTQLQDNLTTFDAFEPLIEIEKEAIEKVTKIYRNRQMNDCTGCNYCMPCPFGVNIPGNFKIWNESSIYEDFEGGKKKYLNLEEEKRAVSCKECGACEPQCPQFISIINDLKKVSELFG
jgi:hypothetical protein